MIYSVVGYYALILGLISGSILTYFSVQNFRNSEILDTKILSLSFLQLFFVVISFFGLVLSLSILYYISLRKLTTKKVQMPQSLSIKEKALKNELSFLSKD